METSKCSKVDCFVVGIHYHVFIRSGILCLDQENIQESKIKVQCPPTFATVEKEKVVPEVPEWNLVEAANMEDNPNLESIKETIKLLRTRFWLLKSSAREILDENWLRLHVRQSRDSLQIRKCGDEACCKLLHANHQSAIFPILCLQVLKSRFFRYWYPLPPVYFHWSSKQQRSPAPVRICKCRDHVKGEQKLESGESEDLSEMAGGVAGEVNTEVIPNLQEAARLWRMRMYGSIYKNQ